MVPKITVAALRSTQAARERIVKAGGEALLINLLRVCDHPQLPTPCC